MRTCSALRRTAKDVPADGQNSAGTDFGYDPLASWRFWRLALVRSVDVASAASGPPRRAMNRKRRGRA